mgnify:FL=1|jgi:hypothetical protein|tara:strand:+ start:1036 stop:1293 length:258 start_codon:yes stop_codon:yes gene_type:complete
MSKPVHTGYEIGYEEEGALEYFWQSLEDDKEKREAYFDATKHKIVTHKWREITDADDEAQGLKDWEWYIEVFKLKGKNDDNTRTN